MIKRTTCPFLGLKDDPTTALNYPSEGNYCHHARPTAPVIGNYQRQYCLSAEHTACPIFQATQPQPLPVALTSPSYINARPRRILAILGIPVLLAGTTALVLAWNVFGGSIAASRSIPFTGMGAPGAWSLLVTESQNTPTVSPTPEPSLQTLKTDCPLPSGWEPYVVNPTDSLFRLSVIYGVPVEQLQQVNCLEDEVVIFPGQVIYVPFVPTDTPSPTITPVTVFPTSTPQPAQREVEPPPPANEPPSPTNTSVPPRPTAKPVINNPTPAQPTVKPVDNNKDEKKDQDKKDKDKDKDKDKGKKEGKGKGKGK